MLARPRAQWQPVCTGGSRGLGEREARVVAAVCGALTTSGVDYTRIIKILAATMRLES